MTQLTEIKLPDIGDFKDVPVIELLVKPGDTVEKETSLITLETDKATMEIPSPQAGVVKEIHVKIGDKVSEGSVIATLDVAEAAAASKPAKKAETREPETQKPETPATPPKEGAPKPAQKADDYAGKVDLETQVLVLGSGPGGYTAAFRAADLGLDVTLIERIPELKDAITVGDRALIAGRSVALELVTDGGELTADELEQIVRKF